MNAKTSAERVRAHRERKKAGANIYKLTITSEQLEKAKQLTGTNPDKTPEEILMAVLGGALARFDLATVELMKLKELGATQAMADSYIRLEVDRMKPLPAEEFLKIVKEGNLR